MDRQKWEYLIERGRPADAELVVLGQDGWELVTVLPGPPVHEETWIFKRSFERPRFAKV